MRTKVDYNGKTIAFTEGEVIDIHCAGEKMHSDLHIEVEGEEGITPSGTLDITENGKKDVTAYAEVNVNVPIPDGYIVPTGIKDITENGTHDVTEYASVIVNVPNTGSGGITPSGTINITQNGTHNVSQYENANVNVPTKVVDGAAPIPGSWRLRRTLTCPPGFIGKSFQLTMAQDKTYTFYFKDESGTYDTDRWLYVDGGGDSDRVYNFDRNTYVDEKYASKQWDIIGIFSDNGEEFKQWLLDNADYLGSEYENIIVTKNGYTYPSEGKVGIRRVYVNLPNINSGDGKFILDLGELDVENTCSVHIYDNMTSGTLHYHMAAEQLTPGSFAVIDAWVEKYLPPEGHSPMWFAEVSGCDYCILDKHNGPYHYSIMLFNPTKPGVNISVTFKFDHGGGK